MNSSPLNPDAPVFIPGTVAGSDVLLAESPRKPLPMDDIELPDVAQFQTEAVVRPAELLDLDNCDQLNGHHNVSMNDAVKERLNGNDKCTMDSLGFGFNVGIEPDKVKDSGLIQDFERIQKDTTDFCNIQVFQTHSETNPFASEGNDELFERLKNKERDPMSMSFYQEKDDDTCERLLNNSSHVDLNAVQPLPDSDDEELQTNGICDNDKENISPEQHTHLFEAGDILEPNNDIMRFEERTDVMTHNIANFGQDNCMEYLVSSSNMSYPNIELESANIPQDTVLQTDTPESHKLLFEQIPEIPDGKSSELGFTNDDNQDPSESEKDIRASTPQDETSQDVEMESKLEDSPLEELQPELTQNQPVECERVIFPESIHLDEKENELNEEQGAEIQQAVSPDQLAVSPVPVEDKTEEAITPEPAHGRTDVSVDVHQAHDEIQQNINDFLQSENMLIDSAPEIVEPQVEASALSPVPSDAFAASPLPIESPLPVEPEPSALSPQPTEQVPASPLPSESPAPQEALAPSPGLQDPVVDLLQPSESPAPTLSPQPTESALRESPLPEDIQRDSPLTTDASLARDSPLPTESPLPREVEVPEVSEPAVLQEIHASIESQPIIPSPGPTEELIAKEQKEVALSPLPANVPLPGDSPAPYAEPVPSAPEHEVVREPTPLQERLADIAPETETTVVEAAEEAPLAAPAPDLVSESRLTDLVTDVDVGVPESRAQEICVPVTSEIRPEDGEHVATPPPTPAVDAPAVEPLAAAVGAAAVAATAAAAVTAAAKKATPAKKSPTTPAAKAATPKSAAKPTAPARTPVSATKRPTTAPSPRTLAAPRPAPARTPLATKTASPATKPATPAAAKTTPTPKPAPTTRVPAARPAATARPASAPKPAAKPASAPATARAAPAPKTTAAPRAPAPRPAPARPATARPATTAAPKPAPSSTMAAAKPAPRPAAPRPPPIKKLPEKKPLTNGDVKETKPAPRPTPIARPAPRPAPRAALTATAPVKAAAARPLSRAPLDKQSKDLANKRITAKAAPPRTAATKAAVGVKNTATKVGPKKSVDNAVPATNGVVEDKAPPSPPADNTLLPDVIA